MRALDAMKLLAAEDRISHHVYSKAELGELFDESGVNLTATVDRLRSEDVLKRAARGIYVYTFSQHLGQRTLDAIAIRMRPGKILYESIESAAFYWGLISQAVFSVTYITDGKPGRFDTAYGPVEFVHSSSAATTMANQTVSRTFDGRVPIATKRGTFDDMARHRRFVGLLREQYLKDAGGFDGTVFYGEIEDDDTWDFLTPEEAEWLSLASGS